MAYTEGNGEFVKSDDRGISVAPFETTNVLLAEPGNIGELLLCQTLSLSEPPDVLTDQPAHIHAQRSARLHNLSLSTIICHTRSKRPQSVSGGKHACKCGGN